MAKPKPDPFPDLPGERFFSISQVCGMFAGRSRRWIEQRVKAGEFGTVLVSEGQYLVSLSGLREWVRQHAVEPGELAPELSAGAANLVQLRKHS